MAARIVTAQRVPLRRALVVLVVTAALLALAEAVLAARVAPEYAFGVAMYPVVGAAFVAVGALAWRRRPTNGTGFLLVLTGVMVLAAAAQNTEDPTLLVVGLLAGQLPIVAALHLTLAFPGGRLTDRFDRAVVGIGYVLVVLAGVPVAFPSVTAPTAVTTLMLWVRITLFTVAGGRAIVRAVRNTGAGSSERRVMLGVTLFGGLLQLFFVVSARILAPLLDLGAYDLFVLQIMVFVFAPFVYAAGVLRGGFGRSGELTELATWLGSQPTGRGPLRDALAKVLGDPSVQVLYAWTGGETLIDADGRPVAPVVSPDRGTVAVVGADGRTASATISYDRSLLPDAAVVEQAGQVVSLALERQRLDVELLAEREALRASRTRLVEVGDERRRQFAQDLHDVLQSRLTLAALHAGALAADTAEPATKASATRLRDELDLLITEFRQVVHGVMPALLVERGLAAAAEDLVDRQPVPATLELRGAERLPTPLATTAYFILAEALTNAIRHGNAATLEVAVVESAGELLVEVRDDGVGGATIGPGGAGLRGIADRVDAHAGRLSVHSPPGGGTRLTVVLPCAS